MLTSSTSRLALLTVLAALVAAASTAPAASAAAQRYTSPTGSGDCSSASPCSITEAVSGANAGDEVVVNPGDYALTATLMTTKAVTIHGVAGQPRPRLQFSGAAQNGLHLYNGGTLRYVEIDQATAPRALVAYGVTVDQVIAKAPGPAASPAVEFDNGTIRNSIVVSRAPNGRAIVTDTNGGTSISIYRNVTAIATGNGGVAIEAYAGFAGKTTIDAANVIARGGAGGHSFVARTDSSGAQATIDFVHSNWLGWSLDGTNAAINANGGNQNAFDIPVFVNAAMGDYRQAPGSPTIDAGIDDDGFDVDGDPRRIGTTDIGADEFVPASTPTPTPPASPAPTPASTTPTPTPAFAGVKLVSTRLSLGGGFIALRLSCPAGTVGRCSGRTKLTARRHPGAAAAVTLGRAPFSIAPGSQRRVMVRVTRAGRRLLSSVRRLRAKDTNAARDGAGTSKTTVTSVTIRRRHR